MSAAIKLSMVSVATALFAASGPAWALGGAAPSQTLNFTWQGQVTGYYCGPASTRIALSTRMASPPSQQDLAAFLGTTTDGTSDVSLVANALNSYLGTSAYSARYISDPPPQAQVDALKQSLVATISNGFPLVGNIISGWRPPGYPSGTIYHYIAIVGYDQDGDRALIADPAGQCAGGSSWCNVPASYWVTTQDLAVWISGKGYAGTDMPIVPVDVAPRGYLDGADCSGVRGWAQDQDLPTQAISVDLYFGGPAGSGVHAQRLLANVTRQDLCAAIGSCDHGYARPAPRSLMDGAAHDIHAYGLDANGSLNAELGSSPQALVCKPAETGVRRHVVDPNSFTAWRFDSFEDVRPVDAATFSAFAAATDWPATPVLVQEQGQPAVYLVDGVFKRHVPDPETAAAWRLDLGQVQLKSSAEIQAMPSGPDLRSRPTLIQGAGPEVDVLDDPLPVAGTGSTGTSGTSTSGSSGSTGSSGSASGSTGTSGSSTRGTSGQVSPVPRAPSPAPQLHGAGCSSIDGGEGLLALLAVALVRRHRKEA